MNKKKVLIIVGIVLSLCIIGICTYLVLDKSDSVVEEEPKKEEKTQKIGEENNFISENQSNTNEEKKPKEKYEKVLEIFSLIDKLSYSEYFGYLYDGQKHDVNNLPKDFILETAFLNLRLNNPKVKELGYQRMTEELNTIDISVEEVLESELELYGTTFDYHKSFTTSCQDVVTYDEQNNKYIFGKEMCDMRSVNSQFKTEIKEIKTSNNIVEIYETVKYIAVVIDNGMLIGKEYTNFDKTKLIEKDSDIPVYKLVFEIDDNNNYIFKSIEKVN